MTSRIPEERSDWGGNPLDLEVLDDAFEDVHYLNNYNENDFQSLNDLDLSLLLPDTPPDTPDNDSQASNPSDNVSDICNSPSSSSSSSNSSISGSSNEFLYSPSVTLHQQNLYHSSPLQADTSLLQNQSFMTVVPPSLPNPSHCIAGEPLIFAANGYTNYQPFVQTIPFVQAQSNLSGNGQSFTKQSNFKPIACKPSLPQPQQQYHHSIQSPASSTSSSCSSSQESKKSKLEERKKKNRIASTNSRLKQKDYLTKMEKTVRELTEECHGLKNENRTLKARVKELENILELKSPIDFDTKDVNGNYYNFTKDKLSPSKTKLSMFAVLCFVCFQVSPYFGTSLVKTDNTPTINSTEIRLLRSQNYPIHYGRHLLWNSEDDNKKNLMKKFADDGTYYDNSTAKGSEIYRNTTIVKCLDYLNQTESIRLENELRDLLNRLMLEDYQIDNSEMKKKAIPVKKTMGVAAKNRRNNNKKFLLLDSKNVPIPKLKMWMNKQNNFYAQNDPQAPNDNGEMKNKDKEQNDKNQDKNYRQKLIDDSLLFDYGNLLGNIHRRDDTFYYLSYPSNGHLFLPPISNRTDIRPRFSFLIPSFNNLTLDDSLNDKKNTDERHRQLSNSSQTHQMVLLQIDCQVINTKVTLINSDVVLKNNFKN